MEAGRSGCGRVLRGALWCGLAMGGVVMAQDGGGSDGQVDQIKQAAAQMDAERARVEAQLALRQAQAKLRAAEAAEQQAAAEQAKALADAQTQAAAARYLGDVKAGPYSGAVSTKEGAGEQEGRLLAARAVQMASEAIAANVDGVRPTVLVFAAKDFPRFQVLASFRLRTDVLRRELTVAAEETGAGPTRGAGVASAHILPPVAAASLGLDAVQKLLGFFKTDYEVAGVAASVDESVLVNAVAGAMARGRSVPAGRTDLAGSAATSGGVFLPTLYGTPEMSAVEGRLAQELQELYELRAKAEARLGELRASDAAEDGELAKRLAASIDGLDGYMSGLATPDATGVAPGARLLFEYATDQVLRGGSAAALLLRLENSGGGYVVKKNLFSGLWGVPMYSSGGATASFVMLAGEDGHVLAGGTVPVYGGLVKLESLQTELRGGPGEGRNATAGARK